MRYSFIMPAYKKAFLESVIKSILEQTLKEFELVIVNDCSPELLDDVVHSFADSRIRYYKNEENVGKRDLVAQWNKCLSYAKGEYVILASDDDIYDPCFLEEMDALSLKYPNANVFSCRKRIVDENNKLLDVDGYLNEYMTPIEFAYWLFSGCIYSSIPNYMFRRQELVKNKGFINMPLAWYSDDATILAASNAGVVISSKALFSFRFSGINISTITDKQTCKKKLLATSMFFDFGKKHINHQVEMSEYDSLFIKRLNARLVQYVKSKTQGLVKSSPVFTLYYIYRNRKSMSFVNLSWLLKMGLSNLKRHIM